MRQARINWRGHELSIITYSVLLFFIPVFFSCNDTKAEKEVPIFAQTLTSTSNDENSLKQGMSSGPTAHKKKPLTLDTALYDARVLYLCHGRPSRKWPVKTAYPLAGAILPFKRIVAYYGNFYTSRMGVLGENPPDSMLNRLMREVKKWQQADTLIPVLPAIHYVAVTAQKNPGKDHKYRARMPSVQIDKSLDLAKKINGIVFLDIQVGWGNVRDEIIHLEEYLRLPDVHLGIDPEYSMKGRQVPCTAIGTFDASDINAASEQLARIVKAYDLPPKILVVHRFTREMVTNYRQIVIRPEVQIVMNMDGFGFPAKKIDSYIGTITNEPVQFAGFKLFYKYDILTAPKKLMTPEDVLKLYPSPIYIQYQ